MKRLFGFFNRHFKNFQNINGRKLKEMDDQIEEVKQFLTNETHNVRDKLTLVQKSLRSFQRYYSMNIIISKNTKA